MLWRCDGRWPSQSEASRSATRHNQRRNAHHHKRATASPRYSTRARVRDCAPTNNTHPTTQRRRRQRRRRSTTPALPITTRAQTRERKGRTRGFLDGGIAPKGAQTHSRRPTSARKQGRRQKFLGTREEDEERTTAACDVPAEVQRLEPPTRAPRGAGARARARLLAQRGRRGAAQRQREESARRSRRRRS